MKKFIEQLGDLGWALGGTGLVLITLSGQTRTWGIFITLITVAVWALSVVLGDSDE